MAPKKKDIEDGGGTCEKVATDFWECTDKNGKVWWCSNRGQTCVPKPHIFTPPDDGPLIHTQLDLYTVAIGPNRYVTTTPIGRTPELDESLAAYRSQNERVSRALLWVRDHEEVREAVTDIARSAGPPLPDALIVDPTLIASAAVTAAGIASEKGAPEDVSAALAQLAARYRDGVTKLSKIEYTVQATKGLKGLRDRFELEPQILSMLEAAPDEANRNKLTQLLGLIRRPLALDTGFPPGGGLGVDCDWGCCAFACILCNVECVLCCAAACLLCVAPTTNRTVYV